jgi:hypothetical protein
MLEERKKEDRGKEKERNKETKRKFAHISANKILVWNATRSLYPTLIRQTANITPSICPRPANYRAASELYTLHSNRLYTTSIRSGASDNISITSLITDLFVFSSAFDCKVQNLISNITYIC